MLAAMPLYAAMDFDGTASYAKMDESILTASPWTVSFWYRSTATTSTRAAFYLAATGSTTPLLWMSRIGAADVGAAPCDVAGRARLRYRSADVGCDFSLCIPKLVNDGQWHFIAASATSNTAFALKVDTITATGSDADCANFPATDRTAVGARFRAAADFFDDADIENVRVSSRALSAAELESLADSRTRLLMTDKVAAHWPLDDGADAQVGSGLVLDRSGDGRHLTAVSGPVYRASDNLSYP